MSWKLEDLTCKDCGTNWSDPDGDGWFLKFGDNPGLKKKVLLWGQCRACQTEQERFTVDVVSDIHWLPETAG